MLYGLRTEGKGMGGCCCCCSSRGVDISSAPAYYYVSTIFFLCLNVFLDFLLLVFFSLIFLSLLFTLQLALYVLNLVSAHPISVEYYIFYEVPRCKISWVNAWCRIKWVWCTLEYQNVLNSLKCWAPLLFTDVWMELIINFLSLLLSCSRIMTWSQIHHY